MGSQKLEVLSAEALLDPAAISRFLNGKVGGAMSAAQIGRLMSACSLKFVASDRVCVSQHELDMLRRCYAMVILKAPELLAESEV